MLPVNVTVGCMDEIGTCIADRFHNLTESGFTLRQLVVWISDRALRQADAYGEVLANGLANRTDHFNHQAQPVFQ